jgi:hypothetical protein
MVVLLSFRTTISPPLLVVTLACLLGTRPSSAQTKIGDVIGPVRETRLENGLTVVVQEDHRVPLVSLALRYQGGEQAAPGGQWAVAQLTTALMLRHTQHAPAGDYDRLASPPRGNWDRSTLAGRRRSCSGPATTGTPTPAHSARNSSRTAVGNAGGD